MTGWRSVPVLQVLDAVVHGVVVALLVGGVVAVFTLATGGTATRIREHLFLVGLVALALGTLATRPNRRQRHGRGEQSEDVDTDETPTSAQEHLARLVPGRQPLAPSEQFSRGAWLLVAGVLLQAVAFLPV